MATDFDVIVIGGGHAGCEAAAAAARMGAKTALVTPDKNKIGVMSCNPAIGGLGKGHIVREIDALDGIMAKVADQAAIQYTMLNASKGIAVQGPRSQIDRELYKMAMQREIANTQNLTVVEGLVCDLIVEAHQCKGVVLDNHAILHAKAVVVTTGTFLKGTMHIGAEVTEGGRLGDKPANALAERFYALNLEMGRLKTGTPARLKRETINWKILDAQKPDVSPRVFSYFHKFPLLPQIDCGITRTTAATHKIIHDNYHLSAIFQSGVVQKGPRYCPSIEDKLRRFSDKESHQIFLEPEGLNSNTVYPNGLSNALPQEIQTAFLRTIPGLENVEIMQFAYFVAYDYVNPIQLKQTLELKKIPGLFLSGQINGTTGYEEAAGQGLVAGANAALKALKRHEDFIIGRDQGYIGVMINDLVTKGVIEPYRMFTSRAEYRLSMRADNADQCLTTIGYRFGLVGSNRYQHYLEKTKAIEKGLAWAKATKVSAKKVMEVIQHQGTMEMPKNVLEVIRISQNDKQVITDCFPEFANLSQDVQEKISVDAIYGAFIDRQSKQMLEVKKSQNLQIPDSLYENYIFQNLSKEVQEKMRDNRPLTLADAERIQGITPAALYEIMITIKKINQVNRQAS